MTDSTNLGHGKKETYTKMTVVMWCHNFDGSDCLTKLGRNHASQWIRDLCLKGVLLILAYF